MGTDIHMKVVSQDKVIIDSLFDGRNYSWFNKILDEDDEYALLDWEYSVPEGFFPDNINPYDLRDKGYYGFKYVSLPSLLNWFDTYKPNITAGWVRKIDAWKYKVKGIPLYEDDIYPYLEDDAIIQDWEFIEVDAPNDCMQYVIETIRKEVPAELIENSYLVVYFDS